MPMTDDEIAAFRERLKDKRELRRVALGLAPYHQSAGAIVNTGVLFGLAFALLGVPHPWLGFFAGAVPSFLILAKYHADQEAEWDREDAEDEDDLNQEDAS
jgi:4-hydroxybenzoate polyprenyltransferase